VAADAARPPDRDAAEIEIQFAAGVRRRPTARQLRQWAAAALGTRPGTVLTIRVVDEPESQALNLRFRDRDYPTNILSFPADDWPQIEGEPVAAGDIVVCAPVVEREAAEQGKSATAHWAHIVVHGVLHLIGFDHQVEAEAAAMEDEERKLLAGFGFPDPYGDE